MCCMVAGHALWVRLQGLVLQSKDMPGFISMSCRLCRCRVFMIETIHIAVWLETDRRRRTVHHRRCWNKVDKPLRIRGQQWADPIVRSIITIGSPRAGPRSLDLEDVEPPKAGEGGGSAELVSLNLDMSMVSCRIAWLCRSMVQSAEEEKREREQLQITVRLNDAQYCLQFTRSTTQSAPPIRGLF
jgi:hypothetical protein